MIDSIQSSWILKLHVFGDIIGHKFRNHDLYTINGMQLDIVNEMIYQFITFGGINGLDVAHWDTSENIVYLDAMIKSLAKYKGIINEKLILHFKNEFRITLHYLSKKIVNQKKYTITKQIMQKYITKFTDSHDARFDQFDDMANNNDCATRSFIIGILFSDAKEHENLANLSITTSMLTHNNPLAYLAGYNTALFSSLAIQQIPIQKWPHILLDNLNSDYLKSLTNLSLSNLDIAEAYNQYIKVWKNYLNTRFQNNVLIRNKAFSNPMHRARYFNDNFYKDSERGKLQDNVLGITGYLAIIIAYDSLLECDGFFEKLLIYSVFSVVDAPSIGSIACALYAAFYKKGDVPMHLTKQINKNETITDLSNQIKKLYKNYQSV